MPGVVDSATVARLDAWLLANLDHLPDFSVRKPRHRSHKLLRPDDAGGWVGVAIQAISTHLKLDAAKLVELAAFVVRPGATAQTLHRDRRQAGFVSCQLALHDVAVARGGLALMPHTFEPSQVQRSSPTGPRQRFRSHVARGARLVRTCGDPGCLATGRGLVELTLPAGAVACYEGRILHGGRAHRGGKEAPARRAIYFTAWYDPPGGGGAGSNAAGIPKLGEAALHPSLRCAPLRHAPLLAMQSLREANASAWRRKMCQAAGGM